MLAFDETVLKENRARLESMSGEELELLRRKRDRFALLSPHDQDKLRQLDRDLHREPNAEQLMQTLRGYHDWLATLRSGDQARLQDMDAAQRIAEIREMVSLRRQMDIGLTDATRLPPEDNEALRKWLGEFVRRKQEEIAKLFPAGERPQESLGRRGFQSQVVRLVFSVARDIVPEDKLEQLVTIDDMAELTKTLSQRANQILNDQPSHSEKVRLIFRWVNASYVPRVGEEELRRFLSEVLNDQQREIIYRLGPEEGRSELMRLYREYRQRRIPPRPPDGERGPFPDDLPRGRLDPDRGPPRIDLP
jgi:hypothetical protein